MRVFIAIELEDRSKRIVSEAQRTIQKNLKGIKWVEYENLHITLKFLGDLDEGKVERVKKVIKKVSSDTDGFYVSGGSFGAFPTPHKARVLFFGIKEGKDHIYNLFEKLEQELGKIGFEREKKPYHPHITVGRGKRQVFDVSEFLNLNATFRQKVKSITLFKSTLTPKGPIYDVLMRGELK